MCRPRSETRHATVAVLAAALVVLGSGRVASAFHSGGVGECSGCHSMHGGHTDVARLLIGSDPSSTCLRCHEQAGDTGPTSYHVSTAAADMPAGAAPRQRTPGGDFGWLRKTYTFTLRGVPTTDPGERNGHNIVAGDHGYVADSRNTSAPGGTFPASQLGCTSCHDPHNPYRRNADGTIGKNGQPIRASGSYRGSGHDPTASAGVGVYRLLAGSGYATGGVTFGGVPVAKAPEVYNQTETTNQVRVAYGAGTGANVVTWSTWCTTCHANMQGSSSVHPSDRALGTKIAAAYNAYVKSGDLTGAAPTAFTSLVPFAAGTSDHRTLAGLAGSDAPASAGPQASDQVMCLTCHRAHASGWPYAMRWNGKSALITSNGEYPGTDATDADAKTVYARGRTKAETQAAYYDRPATQFATYQRALCSKCHGND